MYTYTINKIIIFINYSNNKMSILQFEQLLPEKLGEHNPEEVEELIIDGLLKVPVFTEEHKRVLEHYNNLVHLSMNDLGLEQLDNFPKLPLLETLELSNNKLKCEDLNLIVPLYPKLYKIKLSHNTIEKKEVLTLLNSSTVEKIEIRDNPFVKGENYREEIFDILPNIVIVDDQTKSGQEVDTTHYDEEEEEYIYEDEYRDEKEDDYNDDDD